MEFKQVRAEDIDAFELLATWYNDPRFKYYIGVNFDEKPMPDKTPRELREAFEHMEGQKETYLICVENQPVGEVGLDINPNHVIKKEPRTGWLSIIIGEASYQGAGVAQEAIRFIEQRAVELGIKRMELGVFESNKRAIHFYEKMGYTAFHRIKAFTYIPDSWTDDIRMEKELVRESLNR